MSERRRMSFTDIERIERRQQAWEDRPPSTMGDVSMRLNQQDEDIKALIAEVRALENDYANLAHHFNDKVRSYADRPQAKIPPIEPHVETGWADLFNWLRRRTD